MVLCGHAVLSECVSKPYMNYKQHVKIKKAMAAKLLLIPSSSRFGRSLVYLRTNSYLVVAITISDYQKLPVTGKQGLFGVAKQRRCAKPFKDW